MILRRFVQHVKEQNWFAVGLDVIVVIVGIFLGMQVQQWYEERNDAELGNSYLNRIAIDINNDSEQLELKVNQWIKNSEKIKSNDHYLTTGDLAGKTEWEIYVDIYYLAGWTAFITNSTTYDELVSTGLFRLIDAPDIRYSISEYYNRFNETDEFYNYETPTRHLVRQAYSPDAQSYLWNVCFSAEQYRVSFDGNTGCEPGINSEEVTNTLNKLRNTPGLIEAFRTVNSVLILNISAGKLDAKIAKELATKLKSITK